MFVNQRKDVLVLGSCTFKKLCGYKEISFSNVECDIFIYHKRCNKQEKKEVVNFMLMSRLVLCFGSMKSIKDIFNTKEEARTQDVEHFLKRLEQQYYFLDFVFC